MNRLSVQPVRSQANHFDGAQSKGLATRRNVSKLTFLEQDWARAVCRFSVLFSLPAWEARFYSAIWRSESRGSSRYLKVRDISRSLRFLWFILWLIRGRKNYYFGFPGVWTGSPVSPVRSEETLSWGISRLRYCDPRKFGVWKITMKLCTSFGKRLVSK